MSDDVLYPAIDALLLTIDDLSSRLGVEPAWIVALVEHGALETKGASASDWRFEEVALVRVAKARRLSTDLDINPPGIAMVLDLLDEIERLRVELATLRPR